MISNSTKTSNLRCDLISENKKDTLNEVQLKKVLIRDYSMDGNAYIYKIKIEI